MNNYIERLYNVVTSPEYKEAERQLMDDSQWQEWQKPEEEQRQFQLLKALQKVHRAGLVDEALLLAFEGGVLSQFKKELEHARNR